MRFGKKSQRSGSKGGERFKPVVTFLPEEVV